MWKDYKFSETGYCTDGSYGCENKGDTPYLSCGATMFWLIFRILHQAGKLCVWLDFTCGCQACMDSFFRIVI